MRPGFLWVTEHKTYEVTVYCRVFFEPNWQLGLPLTIIADTSGPQSSARCPSGSVWTIAKFDLSTIVPRSCPIVSLTDKRPQHFRSLAATLARTS